jgi:hypothetical protein
MDVKYLGEKLSIGDHFFYCNSVKKNKVNELVAQWKNKIVEMQNGKSAYIAVEWDTIADEVLCLSTLKCLKAIKQEGKIRLLSVEAVDPFYDAYDEDYWLWTFSDLEARQLSWIWIGEFCLAEYSVEKFTELSIYSGAC